MESKARRERKGTMVIKESKETREIRESKETRVRKEIKVIKEKRAIRETKEKLVQEGKAPLVDCSRVNIPLRMTYIIIFGLT